MTPVTVGIIAVGFLFVLLLWGMPIGIVMGMIGFFGFAFLKGFGPAFGLLQTVPYSTFANYDMTVIPLFVLMGELAFAAGLSQDLYHAIYSWLGRIRGGLAIATVGGCAGFAAICGSSVATAITMGTVALPEMKKCRYDPMLSTGCVAAGGTIGILIPPSIGFIIYGIITEQSIGKLFMAGFIPGIIEAIMFMIIIYIMCVRNPLLGPPGKETSFREKLLAIKDAWIVLTLFVIVIGGIYIGVFTPTEAAGIGATGVFIFAIIRKRLTWQAFKSSLAQTGKTIGMCFVILLGAMFFSYFLSVSRLPFEIARVVGEMELNRYLILTLIIIVYLFLGCVMDTISMILITLPIFFPLVQGLNFDPILFGVLIVIVSEAGLITPPVGINVFVIQAISGGIPMYSVFRGIFPFFLGMIILIVFLVAFPQVTLLLPNMMK